MRRAILAATAALVVLTLSACGGGGGGNNNNTVTVTVSPATANVQEGSQQQFVATVTNTNATAVTWQVNSITGGNAAVGTIDTNGVYTAPDVIPSPASVTITAFLQAAPNISGNAIVTITAVTFSNSSLKGNFVLSLSGVDGSGNAFYAVGAITTDGNGNVTASEEDLNDVTSGYLQATTGTGTYSVGSDGRGTLNLNNSIGNFQFAIAMKALNNAVLNQIDNTVVAASGNLEAQTAGVGAPSGNYAFGFSGSGLGCGPVSSAGIFALSGGTVGGVQDLNCNGTITTNRTLTGSFVGIDTLGRGTGSFGSNGLTSNMIYYVVSASHFRFLADPNAATYLLGSADLQTQSSFASTDFNGSYVINTSANTSAGVSYTLIQINASGGTVSSGYYDVNNTGTVGQASLSGAYTVGSNGYVNGTWNVNNVSLPFGLYLISPTQGYYLDERTSATGGGNIYAQNPAVTTNAAWAGSYATRQFGYFLNTVGPLNPQNASSVSGQLSADGNGNLAGTLDFNDPQGVLTGQTLQGTYSVGTVAPGRTTLSLSTPVEGTRSYVGYIVNSGQVLLLETDTNLVSGGDAIRQF